MREEKAKDLNKGHFEFARRIVDSFMTRFGVAPYYFDDYLGAAYGGLVEAASRYDSDLGIPFEKYAYLRVRGSIIDHIRCSNIQSVKQYQALKLLEASDCLAEDFQSIRTRIPSENIDQALAEVLEYAAKGALIFRLNYLDVEQEILEHNPPEKTVDDRIVSKTEGRNLHAIVDKLPPREQLVIRAVYFEGLSFNEVASERLHVSRSWVSRIHGHALKRIREELTGIEEEIPKPKQKRRRRKCD